MKVYTFSEARQRLASVLDEARRKGAVRVKRQNGQEFIITPVREQTSPFDVEGVEVGLSAEEIVNLVRETRER